MAKKKKVVYNFDDLGADVKFEFGGTEYTIPAISQETSERLAELATEMKVAVDNEDFVAANRKQFEYVVAAMAGVHSEEEIKKFPKRVIGAIMRVINEDMQGLPDLLDEESEESAKK